MTVADVLKDYSTAIFTILASYAQEDSRLTRQADSIMSLLTDGTQASCKKCHCNPFGDVCLNPFFRVFSLPEYLIPSFLGLINRPHAASYRIFSS